MAFKSKVGLSGSVLALGLVTVMGAALTLSFLLLAATSLAER